jgi:hypothetical protein
MSSVDAKDIVNVFGDLGALVIVDVEVLFVRHVFAAERIARFIIVSDELKSMPSNGKPLSRMRVQITTSKDSRILIGAQDLQNWRY